MAVDVWLTLMVGMRLGKHLQDVSTSDLLKTKQIVETLSRRKDGDCGGITFQINHGYAYKCERQKASNQATDVLCILLAPSNVVIATDVRIGLHCPECFSPILCLMFAALLLNNFAVHSFESIVVAIVLLLLISIANHCCYTIPFLISCH